MVMPPTMCSSVMPSSDELVGPVDQLVDAVGVGPLVLLGPDRERAEAAPDHADVGGVEVRVDVVRDGVAVAAAHHGVGRGAEILEGRVAVEGDGLVGGDPLALSGAREDGVGHVARGYQGLPSPCSDTRPALGCGRVAEHALKEWAVTIAALEAGDQVLIVRKGGIGEKRFELPHPRFYLFPTYAHQRPELVKPAWRERFAGPLAERDRARAPAAAGLRRAALGPPDRGRRGTRRDRSAPHPLARLRRRAAALAAHPPAVGRRPARLARARPARARGRRGARGLRELGGAARGDRAPPRAPSRRCRTRTFARAAADVESALAAAGVAR